MLKHDKKDNSCKNCGKSLLEIDFPDTCNCSGDYQKKLKLEGIVTREDLAAAETLIEIVSKKTLEKLDKDEYDTWFKKIMNLGSKHGPENKYIWPKTYMEYKTIARKIVGIIPETYGDYEEYHQHKDLIEMIIASTVSLTLFYKEKLDEPVKGEQS